MNEYTSFIHSALASPFVLFGFVLFYETRCDVLVEVTILVSQAGRAFRSADRRRTS